MLEENKKIKQENEKYVTINKKLFSEKRRLGDEVCDKNRKIKELLKEIEVKNIEEFANKKVKRITLKLSQNLSEEVKALGGEILEFKDNILLFNYNGDINKLLSLLVKYPIEDLIIEEKKLSEVFMAYYEMEGK